MHNWKGKTICVEEITEWKYRIGNETCDDNYISCGDS